MAAGIASKGTARLPVTFFVLGFRRWSTYRLASLAGAFANTVFGLIRSGVMTAAVVESGGALAGYTSVTAATYAWLGQALLGAVYFFPWTDLAARIRTGDIAVDLVRPVNLQLTYLAADLGRAAYQFIPRGAPPLIVGALVTGLALPANPAPYVFGTVALVLAVALSFACRWLVNLVAFWILDLRGPMVLYTVALNVLCGTVVPVRWFPGWLKAVAAATPFPYLMQLPIDLFTGRIHGWAAVRTLAIGTVWMVGLLAVGQLLFWRGTRRLVVQGG